MFSRNETTVAGSVVPSLKYLETISESRAESARFTQSSAACSLGDSNLEIARFSIRLAALKPLSTSAELALDDLIHKPTATPITPIASKTNTEDHAKITDFCRDFCRLACLLSPRRLFLRVPLGIPVPGMRETRPMTGASPTARSNRWARTERWMSFGFNCGGYFFFLVSRPSLTLASRSS